MTHAVEYVKHSGKRCHELSIQWLAPRYVAVLRWYFIRQLDSEIFERGDRTLGEVEVAERQATAFRTRVFHRFIDQSVIAWQEGKFDHHIED